MYKQYSRYNKFKNVKQAYNNYNYDSKLEADFAMELDLRVVAKDIQRWERQFKISIDINGFHICNYFVDFRILHNDNSYELIETKGMETQLWRLKKKLLEAVWLPENLDHSYTVVKQRSNFRR